MSTKNETAIVEIILKGQQANASLKDIEKSARALRAQLARLPTDSQEFADKSKEFQNINKRLKLIKDDVNGLGGVFGKIGKEIKGFGILAAGYLGFDFLTSSIKGIIKSNGDLSDSLADIRKTTNMTDAEARKLNTSFSQINTRTASKELRNIAIVGGQLGIAKNDIFGFTVAVDKMNVALGDEFTGGAEEVTKAMGGLRNIFTDIKSDKVDNDLLHIGNAINQLASSGAATGPVISDFANRIGGVGINLGLTSGQVLGLSATLQELNVSTERGGTAVTKILLKMTTNTTEFAKVAGIPVKDFTNLVNKDLYGAFIKVVEGSKKSGDSATAFGKILDNLGVDGAGASEVFSKLSSNTNLLDEKVKMANGSLKETSSIMDEFNMKNATLGAEMERLSKGLSNAFTNASISNGLKSIVGFMADLFDKTKKVSEAMAEEQNHVNALMIEIKENNTTSERRNEIYDELKSISPAIVDGINRENYSIQALTENVIKYNETQINRIAIQQKQELVDKANKEASELLIIQSEKSSQAYELLGKIQNSNRISSLQYKKLLDDESLSTSEKIEKIFLLAHANEYKNGKLNNEARAIKELAMKASELTYAENQYSLALNKSNKLVEDKNKLSDQLGLNTKAEIDYTKLSIDELNKFIKDSKESMGNYHKKEGVLALAELKSREIQKKDAVVEIDIATRDKLIEARKKFLLDLEKLEEEYFNRKLSGPEKEEKNIFDKYDKLLKQAKKGSSDYVKIIFLREQELEEFQKIQSDKFVKLRLEAQKRIDDAILPAEQKEIDATQVKYDILIKDAETYGLDAIELVRFRELEKDAIRQKYNEKELADNDKKNKNLGENDKLYDAKKKATVSDYYQAVNTILSNFNEYQKNISEVKIDEMKRQQTVDLAANKRLLNAKIISQGEFNRREKKLEDQHRREVGAIKKKAAENDKKLAIFNAVVNAAMTISRAFKDYQYPASLLIAALAGASAVAQIGAISSAKVPEYAAGGLNKSNNPQGKVNQPTYFTNSSSGQDFIAGEKGAEWIAPNWMLQNPITANTINMLEAVRQRGYVNGGSTAEAPNYKSSKTSLAAINQINNNSNSELITAINNLNSLLGSGINAKLSYDQFNKDISAIDSARNSAQVKN